MRSTRQKVFGTKRQFAVGVGLIILCLLIVTVGPKIGAAFGSAPDRGAQPSICRPGGTPDDVCLWPIKKEVSKFKNGYFKRKSGFSPSKVFAKPAKAKEVIVNHITAKIKKASKGERAKIAAHFNSRDAGCTDRCLAYKMWGEIVTDGSCITRGVPTNEAGTCARTPQSSITQQGVINGITVVVCGAIAVVGVLTKASTLFMGGMGASACMWGGWRAATNDGNN